MTPERVTEVYEALQGLFVTLASDPVTKGPQYLHDLISKTRGYLNQTGHYLQEIHREHHLLEIELDSHEAAFEIKKSELLAGDRRVTLLPSIEDRLAMINVLLGEERRDIQRLKREIKNLSHMEKAVRHRHKELDNTMSAIRLQKQLVDAELRTGSYYGDENEKSRGDKWKKPEATLPDQDLSEDEVLGLLSEAESALESNEETEDSQEAKASEKPEEASDDAEVTRFLDGDEEFDDLFESL